jgi:hypothetical protein
VEPTFEIIQPLLVDEAVEGDVIEYTFECPLSGQKVKAQHDFGKDTSVDSKLRKTALKAVFGAVIKIVSTAAKTFLGKGLAGKMVGGLSKTALKEKGKEAQKARVFTAEQKQFGALQAFMEIADQFVWDGFGQQWVFAAAAGRFLSNLQRQLSVGGLDDLYDQLVAARILYAAAEMPDELTPTEEDFLRSFLKGTDLSLEHLRYRPALTDAELKQTSESEPRHTMIMLAWVMAQSDGVVSTRQQEEIRRFAERLGMDSETQVTMCKYAREFILEEVMRTMYGDNAYTDETRKQVYGFAGQIGMGHDHIQLTEARFLKRLTALA